MRTKKLPECMRCGRTVPKVRRKLSDYCTDRCAKQQAHEDRESAKSERAHLAEEG